jgi:predicted nucleic acid-binding protein
MNGKIICNASPLIFLSKINRLHLLTDLFSEIHIPEGAWNEAIRKPDDVTNDLIEMRNSGKFTVFNVQNRIAVSALIGRLHLGEVEVMIGAGELEISKVILDDGYARSKAKQMGLSVTGTLGILITARQAGILTDISIDIDNLISIGFRISESLLKQINS